MSLFAYHSAKSKKFLLFAILVIVGRFFDVYTTFLYTPDLKNETNVLVVFLGADWTSVILIQSFFVLLAVILLYYYYFRFSPNYPIEKGLTLKQFSSYLYFNDTLSFNKIFYKTPNNKSVLLASSGYVVSMTLIAVSFIVGTSTSLLIISERYKELYKDGIQTSLFVAIGALAIWFSINFFKNEYSKYRKSI